MNCAIMSKYKLIFKHLHGLVGDILGRCSPTCTSTAFYRRNRDFFSTICHENNLTIGAPPLFRIRFNVWKTSNSVGPTYSIICRLVHNKAKGNAESNKQVDNKRFTFRTSSIEKTLSRTNEQFDDRVSLLTENIATIPNVLTTCRIGLTPVIGYLVLQQAYSFACALFLVAGVTDLLDGYIARNYANQRSALGSVLDPVADKLLISVLFVSLTAVHLIPVALTALVITRDVALIIAAGYLRYISLPASCTIKQFFDVKNATLQLQPLFVSKLNTAVQLGLVTATLCAPVLSFVDHPAMHVLWYLTAATTITSGIGYIFAKNTFTLLKQPKKK